MSSSTVVCGGAPEVPSAWVVTAEWVTGPEDLESRTRIELGSGILPSPRAVSGVALSLSDGADLDASQRALTAAIGVFAAEGVLYQAFVTRWGLGVSLDGTPWELACGVHGQCVMERSWVTRWLRGVGEGAVWLGPAIWAAAGRPAGSAVGDAVRIDVADRAAAETALDAILPDTAAWSAGVRARYLA